MPQWYEYFLNNKPAAHRMPPEPELPEDVDEDDLLEMVSERSSWQIEKLLSQEQED